MQISFRGLASSVRLLIQDERPHKYMDFFKHSNIQNPTISKINIKEISQYKQISPSVNFLEHAISMLGEQHVFSELKISQSQDNNRRDQPRINTITYQANNKIQDRVIYYELKNLGGVELIAVFDGHGGDKLSEYCAGHITQLVEDYLNKNQSKVKSKEDQCKLFSDCLTYVYNRLEKDFYENIFKTQMALNNKKIKGVGTCALTVLIHKSKLYVANSGDSEAIITTQSQNEFESYIDLNSRFSVNNPAERKRLKQEFPNDEDIVVEENKGCFYLKGRLQPTRAIGDYHLKYSHLYKGKGQFNGPYIQACPEIKVFNIQDNYQTLVVASDGVWDYATKEAVSKASLCQDAPNQILNLCLKNIANLHDRKVEEIRKIADEEKRSYHDDISLAVLKFKNSGHQNYLLKQ